MLSKCNNAAAVIEADPSAGAVRAEPARPLRAFAISPRDAAPAWAALVALAGLAWVVTVLQARGMGIGVGTMGMALPLFLGMWVAMMAAMMFPAMAPVAILWVRGITRRPGATGTDRAGRIAGFALGYLVAWTIYGLIAFAALIGTQRLVDASPEGAKWLGVGIFAAAGLYQLTPLKDACLTHCRSPIMAFLHYANFKGRARDLRVGVHHGLYCVGCCWGMMLVLVAVGVMNVAAMAGLAAVIFLEKIWVRGPQLVRAVAVAFLVLAVLAVFHPALLPGLHSDAGAGARMSMDSG
jgi:predicted metal-binding membrane protein